MRLDRATTYLFQNSNQSKKYLCRYGNNLQSPKQTPALGMKPPLVKPYLFEAMRMKRAKKKMRSIFLQSHSLNNRDSADPYSL